MFFIVSGIGILLIFTLFGFFTWAASDLPLAIRETALNTREDKDKGSNYAMLNVLSTFTKFFAIIFWITGVVLSYYLVFVFASGQIPFGK